MTDGEQIVNVHLFFSFYVDPKNIIITCDGNKLLIFVKNYELRLAIQIGHKIKVNLYLLSYVVVSPYFVVVCQQYFVYIVNVEFNLSRNFTQINWYFHKMLEFKSISLQVFLENLNELHKISHIDQLSSNNDTEINFAVGKLDAHDSVLLSLCVERNIDLNFIQNLKAVKVILNEIRSFNDYEAAHGFAFDSQTFILAIVTYDSSVRMIHLSGFHQQVLAFFFICYVKVKFLFIRVNCMRIL